MEAVGVTETLIMAAGAVVLWVWYSKLRTPSHLAGLTGWDWYQTVHKAMWRRQPVLVSHLDIMKGDPKRGLARVWFGYPQVMVYSPSGLKSLLTESKKFEKDIGFLDHPFGRWIGRNLVTTVGPQWRKQRKICNPAFHFDFLRHLPETFCNGCQAMINKFDSLVESEFDVHPFMQQMTIDILGLAAFGHDFQTVDKPDNEHVGSYNRILKFALQPGPFILGRLAKYFYDEAQYDRDVRHFDSLLVPIIEKRMKMARDESRRDLLECFLNSMSAEEKDNVLTSAELRDNMVAFFIAGHDTTASSLSNVLWHLAHHQDIQRRVIEEVDSVMGGASRPSYEQQDSLKYLTMVIKESLRRVPSVFASSGRIALQDCTIDGLEVKKGQRFIVSIGGVHRNPEVWSDPETFDPDRFLPEAERKRHPFAWIPFGAGPRNCIGSNFSMMEQRIFLAMFFSRYSVEPGHAGQGLDDFTLRQGALMHPEGMSLRIKHRH